MSSDTHTDIGRGQMTDPGSIEHGTVDALDWRHTGAIMITQPNSPS